MNRVTKNLSTSQSGFTTVEAYITIIIGAMFVISLYLLFTSMTSSGANIRNQATANDIAYSYLRKYASANSTPTWFTCSTATGTSNTNDVTVNASATGQVLESGTVTSNLNGLALPVTYKVTALAIYGCSGANVNKPIRVESQVVYGPSNRTVKHATLVGY